MPTTTTQLSEYVALLLELHQLIANGLGDAGKADSVRDEMDRPWNGLTEAERLLVRGLSTDLYDLEPQGPPPPVRAESEGAAEFERAKRLGDWPKALSVLREHKTSLPREALASLRGVMWDNLGFPNVAGQFFCFAAQVDPLDPTYEVLYLHHRLAYEDAQSIVGRANEIARQSDADTSRLLIAGMILFAEAERTRSPDSWTQAYQTLRRGLDSARSAPPPPGLAFMNQRAVRLLGMYLHRTGRIAEARQSYVEALSLDPADSIAKELLMLAEQDQSKVLGDEAFQMFSRKSRQESLRTVAA